MMNEELKHLTYLCNLEISKIREKYKKLKIEIKIKYKKGKKQHIPKKLKNIIWDKYVGKERGIGHCYCCNEEIDSKNFEAGHIIPEARGGPTNEGNLRPICSCCNKSMGVQNMDEFKKKYMSPRQLINKKRRFNTKMYIDERILINQTLGYQPVSRYQSEY